MPTVVGFASSSVGMPRRQRRSCYAVLRELFAEGGTLHHGDNLGGDGIIHDHVLWNLRNVRVVVHPPTGPDRAWCCGPRTSFVEPRGPSQREIDIADACEVWLGATPARRERGESGWGILEYVGLKFMRHILVETDGTVWRMDRPDLYPKPGDVTPVRPRKYRRRSGSAADAGQTADRTGGGDGGA